MADRRRLQGEIDKTLKKVNEGVDAFDDVWNKLVIVSRLQVQTATNINQKEKYESELKKEIKKLQRLREQIKTWQSSNEIKDKKPLLEARKNIEQQMERFKVIERETKQKPYSKDALGNNYKFDPHHKEQEEIREWLQSCSNKLSNKIEELESRLDDLNANKKKRMDKEKIEATKNSLETHRYYLDTLERIGKMVRKNQFSVKKVQEIRYDIDDFIENSDQPDYSINTELFDELELDKYDSSANNDDDDDDESGDDNDDDEDDADNDVDDADDDEETEEEDEEETEEDEEEEEGSVSNGNKSKSISSGTNHTTNNISVKRNRNRGKSSQTSQIGNSSGSSVSSSSSSAPNANETNTSNGTLSADDEKRRRHKSESGLNQQQNNQSDANQRNSNVSGGSTSSQQQQGSNKRNGNHVGTTSNNNNRTRTNSGAHTTTSTAGNSSTSSTSSSLSNFSSTSKDNKIPLLNHANETTNHTSNSLGDSLIPPPLSQSPFAAVVAGITTTTPPSSSSTTAAPPVSFSAAVSTNQTQKPQQAKSSINSQTTKDQGALASTSPKDSQAFLNQQQQQLSTLIAAANGMNGLNLPADLDKKLSDVVLNSNSTTFIPPGTTPTTNATNNNSAHMNSLKSMAENAVLAQHQQSNPSGFTNTPSDLPIASLLAASLPSGLSDDPNTAAALAALLAQQKGGNINLPAALSALQQQQQNFNDQHRIGFAVQSGGSTNASGSVAGSQQTQNISPSMLMNSSGSGGSMTNQETFIQPILGVAPLGKTPLSKEQNQQLIILESAYKKLPHPTDTERMRNYLPRILINTPSYYPMTPPNGHDSIDFLNKLTSDSLFFMFYYMEGTKAQFLAAQALKKLSWRFHTRYMMWFQRFEEPKVITDEYEMGTYVYFDFEKWGQRKKEGFTFEYKYLEDRDLSSY